MTNRPVTLSTYPPLPGGRPTHESSKVLPLETDIDGLLELTLGAPVTVKAKHLAPAWSPFCYTGGRRLAAQCKSACALVYDLDNPECDYEALQARLEASGYLHAVHETYTPGRARVVIPTSRDINPKEYPSLWVKVAEELELEPDPSGKDLARLFYAPSFDGSRETWAFSGGSVLLDPGGSFETEDLVPHIKDLPKLNKQVGGNSGGAEQSQKFFDLEALREDISKHKDADRRQSLTEFLDGTLRIPPGTRESTLHPLMGTLSHMRNAPPDNVTREMLARVLIPRENSGELLEEWVEKAMHSYTRGLEHKRGLDAEVATVEKFFNSEDWMTKLKRRTDSKGAITGTKSLEANVLSILQNDPAFKGFIKWNVLKNRIEITGGVLEGEPEESLDIPLASWLQTSQYNCEVGSVMAGSCLVHVALANAYDPVSEYLSSLAPWDGVRRIDTVLTQYAQAEGPPDWIETITRKFFISAVARAKRPGCQVDSTLVLQGKQGGGKTSFVRIIGAGFHVETSLDLHNKDAVMTAACNWLVELGELASLKKSDVESVRNFLTRKEDQIRLPYGKIVKTMPRRCVFLGTTNSSQPLTDPDGNRRFWVVSVGTINTGGLAMIRDQLWAEALHAYSHGEEWWLSQEQSVRAAEEARVYETEDVTADELLAWLSEQNEWPEFLTARDVARKVLTKIPGQMTPQEVAAINRTMASMGWRRERKRKDGMPQWHFRVPLRGLVFPS